MAIQNQAIGTGNTTIFTSSNSNGDAITTVIVCNTVVFDPANPLTGLSYLYLYAVPSGASVGLSSQLIVNKLPIPAGETVSFDQEKMVLANGDKLVAKSDTTNLTATVSNLPV
jgi:hypothetical protein